MTPPTHEIGSDNPPRAAEVEPPASTLVIPAGGSATPDMGVTGNAVLLLGFIAGLLGRDMPPVYELPEVDAEAGHQVVRRVGTANTYRVSVVQLDGVE